MSLLGDLGRLRRRAPAWLAPSSAPAGWPTHGPRVVVTLAADYPNLGDVALTRAALAFCAEHLRGHHPYVIDAHQTLRLLRGAARHIGPDDVVIVTGGGNLGNRYRRLEELRCEVVRAFPNQRIIAFPQSCEWSDDGRGREARAYSHRTYATHLHLTLFARDRESLERMRADFPSCHVELAPDTALWLQPAQTIANGPPLLCLRKDGESALGSHRDQLVKNLRAVWPDLDSVDTTAQGDADLNQQLDALLTRFSQARLIITDRLHGLVFARMHGRPCIAIEGANRKLRALVETWFPAAPDIRVLRHPSAAEVLAAANEVTSEPSSPPLDRQTFISLVRAVRGES